MGDICTDSRFVGTVVQTLGKQPLYEQLWDTAWQQSLLGCMPAPSLRLCIWLSWALSLVQLILPLLRTLRMQDFPSKPRKPLETMAGGTIWGDKDMTPSGMCKCLAEASGFMSMQNATIPCSLAFFEQHHKTVQRVTSVDAIWDRVFNTLILENAIQLNIQSAFYALQLSAQMVTDENHSQVPVLQSLTVSFLVILLKAFEVWDFCKVVRVVDECAARPDAPENVRTANVQVARKGKIICAGYAVLTASVAYAATTCLMAHWCEHGIWGVRGCMVAML